MKLSTSSDTNDKGLYEQSEYNSDFSERSFTEAMVIFPQKKSSVNAVMIRKVPIKENIHTEYLHHLSTDVVT